MVKRQAVQFVGFGGNEKGSEDDIFRPKRKGAAIGSTRPSCP